MTLNYRHLKRIAAGLSPLNDDVKRELLPKRLTSLVKHEDKIEAFLPTIVDVLFVDKLKEYNGDIVRDCYCIKVEQKHATVIQFKKDDYTGKCYAVRYNFWQLLRTIVNTHYETDENHFGDVWIDEMYEEAAKFLNYQAKQLNVKYDTNKFEYKRRVSRLKITDDWVFEQLNSHERDNQFIEMINYFIALNKRKINKH